MRCVASLGIGLVAAGLAASVALATQSPAALRDAIFAAARAKHSVHYVTTDIGPVQLRMVSDVAANKGIQRITFTENGQTGHVTVLVAKRTAYIRGDAFAMQHYMGFSPSQASRYHGRWISMPHTWSGYKNVSAAVTFSSFLAEIGPKGSLTRVSGRVNGQTVTGVRGGEVVQGVRVSETLYASTGTNLPVLEKDVAKSKGFVDRAVMSSWNEPVRVDVPVRSVPVTVVAHH